MPWPVAATGFCQRFSGCPRRMRRFFRERQRRAALQRRQHRDQRHRHHQRDRDRERDRQRLVAEQLAGNAFDEHQRQEHRDRGQGRRDHRHADFAGAGDGRLQDRQATFARLGDRFEHHDRIVDDQAGGEREAAERHHVEAQVELVHEEERGDDRDRQRQRDDERAPAVAQEQEDHQDREQAADHRIHLHVADGVADELRLVVDRGQLDVRRHLLSDFRELLLDGIGRGDGIGVAFLVDRQFHRFAAAEADDRLAFLVTLAHLGDVLQPDRHAAAGCRRCIRILCTGRGRHHAGVARRSRDARDFVGSARSSVSAARVVTSMSRISSTLANWLTVRTR